MSDKLKHLLAYVADEHVAEALDRFARVCDVSRHHPCRPLQSQYALGKLKLWEASTHKDACWGMRFSWLQFYLMPGSGSDEYRFQSHQIDPSTMSAKDKEYWTSLDKIWAWGSYLEGADVETICTFVGGRKPDFVEWVKAVCRGEEGCNYGGSFGDYNDPNGWTLRQDRLLWLMYQSRLHFNTTRRLLGKSPELVRARVAKLKESNGPQP